VGKGVATLGLIESVRVGEEGFAACFPNSADDFVNKNGLHITGIAQFSHMQLDGYEVAFLYAVKGSCGIAEPISFI
jgi:hypothetical protein